MSVSKWLFAQKAIILKQEPSEVVSQQYAKVYRQEILKEILDETPVGRALLKLGENDAKKTLEILQKGETARQDNRIMNLRNAIAISASNFIDDKGKLKDVPENIIRDTKKLMGLVKQQENTYEKEPFASTSAIEVQT